MRKSAGDNNCSSMGSEEMVSRVMMDSDICRVEEIQVPLPTLRVLTKWRDES